MDDDSSGELKTKQLFLQEIEKTGQAASA